MLWCATSQMNAVPCQGCRREQLSVRAEVEIGNAPVTDKLARLPARPEVVQSDDAVGAPDRHSEAVRAERHR